MELTAPDDQIVSELKFGLVCYIDVVKEESILPDGSGDLVQVSQAGANVGRQRLIRFLSYR